MHVLQKWPTDFTDEETNNKFHLLHSQETTYLACLAGTTATGALILLGGAGHRGCVIDDCWIYSERG